MNTPTQATVTWAFGTLYFRKVANVCTVSCWPTGVTALATHWYQYANLIPDGYQPTMDIRILAYDNSADSINHFPVIVIFGTNKSIQVWKMGTDKTIYLMISASWILK